MGHRILAIDVGNTNTVLGLYDGERLVAQWRVASDHARMPDEYGMLLFSLFAHAGEDPALVEGVVLASVVPPLTGTFVEVSERYLAQQPLVVDAGVKTGVRIHYDSPRDVGADRVVDAVDAYRIYGGPACVVDFGTATTFNAISAEGDYLGGAIAPGIRLAAEALYTHTAKLRRIDIARPPTVIGTNTVHAMQSGLLFGYVGLVEGMVARFREQLGAGMRVIGTGGLADLIAAETDVIELVDKELTLKGLRFVWEMNQS